MNKSKKFLTFKSILNTLVMLLTIGCTNATPEFSTSIQQLISPASSPQPDSNPTNNSDTSGNANTDANSNSENNNTSTIGISSTPPATLLKKVYVTRGSLLDLDVSSILLNPETDSITSLSKNINLGDPISLSSGTFTESLVNLTFKQRIKIDYNLDPTFTGKEIYNFTVTKQDLTTYQGELIVHVMGYYTWTGNTDNNWDVLSNWCGNVSSDYSSCLYNPTELPSIYNTVIFDNTCTKNCDVLKSGTGTIQVMSLQLRPGFNHKVTFKSSDTSNPLNVIVGYRFHFTNPIYLKMESGELDFSDVCVSSYAAIELINGKFSAPSRENCNLDWYYGPYQNIGSFKIASHFKISENVNYVHNNGKVIFNCATIPVGHTYFCELDFASNINFHKAVFYSTFTDWGHSHNSRLKGTLNILDDFKIVSEGSLPIDRMLLGDNTSGGHINVYGNLSNNLYGLSGNAVIKIVGEKDHILSSDTATLARVDSTFLNTIIDTTGLVSLNDNAIFNFLSGGLDSRSYTTFFEYKNGTIDTQNTGSLNSVFFFKCENSQNDNCIIKQDKPLKLTSAHFSSTTGTSTFQFINTTNPGNHNILHLKSDLVLQTGQSTLKGIDFEVEKDLDVLHRNIADLQFTNVFGDILIKLVGSSNHLVNELGSNIYSPYSTTYPQLEFATTGNIDIFGALNIKPQIGNMGPPNSFTSARPLIKSQAGSIRGISTYSQNINVQLECGVGLNCDLNHGLDTSETSLLNLTILATPPTQ